MTAPAISRILGAGEVMVQETPLRFAIAHGELAEAARNDVPDFTDEARRLFRNFGRLTLQPNGQGGLLSLPWARGHSIANGRAVDDPGQEPCTREGRASREEPSQVSVRCPLPTYVRSHHCEHDQSLQQEPHHLHLLMLWRKGWDSNPRYPCGHAGF